MTVVVACAVWGDWPGSRVGHNDRHRNRGGDASLQATYITRMRNMVQRHMRTPYRFVVFADDVRKVPAGIEAKPLDVPWICRGLPKAYIYGAPFTGCPIKAGTRILVFDLDMVVVGSLDSLIDHDRDLVVRERGYMLPRFVPDGDLIFSRAGSDKAQICADIYHQEVENHGATTDHGDERELLVRADADMWGRVRPGQVVSYKRHCRNKGLPKGSAVPEGARVVSFHGKPLPDQVNDAWVKEHWR